MNQHHRSTRLPALLALVAALAAAPACKAITDAVCPNEPITTTLNASNTLAANTTTASSMTVTRSGGTLPSAIRVQSITIQQADIQFSGTGSGTVSLALVVDGYTATVGTLTITNGAVTGLSPTTYAPGQFSRDDARAIINALPEAQRTTLNLQNIDNLSEAQIRDAVSTALRSSSFRVAVLSRTSSGLQGTVNVQRVTFNVGC
jgi:hypothetical protein